jgi:murein DD-endopeptidase MepM/ murein hydrolase activator NlpD
MGWVAPSRRPERALALAAAVVLAAGCAVLRSPRPAPPESLPGAWYVVVPGDTLGSIATRHGVPVEDLAEVNGLSRGDVLAAGRVIFLLAPQRGQPPSRPRATVAAAPAPLPAVAATTDKLPDEAALRWPLVQPRLSSAFGPRAGRPQPHEGIDLAAPLGTPILAAEAGQVVYAGNEVRGYGNMVVLQHAGGILTVYAHTSVMLVRTGDRIDGGQEIARVGQSGRATAPHLHFEVRRGQVPQDPLRFLPPAPFASTREKL